MWSFSTLGFKSCDCLFSFRITISLSLLSCPVMEENIKKIFSVLSYLESNYQYQIDKGLVSVLYMCGSKGGGGGGAGGPNPSEKSQNYRDS